MIDKAILTAAGQGTRLLPISKELPKEMLPIFVESKKGLILKPLLQVLFEQLYTLGIREFAIVIGRGKRAIEDHFTPDYSFLQELSQTGKNNVEEELSSFYDKIEKSKIIWINQPKPKGFGDAVLRAKSFVSKDDFLVVAGDTYIISKDVSHLKRLFALHQTKEAAASFLVCDVQDPEHYGVVETIVEGGCLKVLSAIEKPSKPKTRTSILPFYVFKPIVFSVLELLEPGYGGEIQLTDAINQLIKKGFNVYADHIEDDCVKLEIGTPETYWNAITRSYQLRLKGER